VTISQTPNTAPAIVRPSVYSVVLWGFIVLTIASILFCLPAFHSATNLHHGNDVVDAFDLGVNAPKPTLGNLGVIVVGALLLPGIRCQGAPRVRVPLVTARIGVPCRPVWRGMSSAHLLRRTHSSRGQSEDDAKPGPTRSMPRMVTTPGFP